MCPSPQLFQDDSHLEEEEESAKWFTASRTTSATPTTSWESGADYYQYFPCDICQQQRCHFRPTLIIDHKIRCYNVTYLNHCRV